MKPIAFCCEETLNVSPEVIARQILDVTRWPDFKGYLLLPGIAAAEFEVKTPSVVGSRIRVTNTDGSTHVEEIVAWEPERRIEMHFKELSAPLSRLATGMEETWDFKRIDDATRVTRSFKILAKSSWARPALWLISLLLKKAIVRHLRQLRGERCRGGRARTGAMIGSLKRRFA